MFSRMTTATMYSSLLSSLQNSMRGMQELQKQIASGNKYTKLADNPTAISKALGMSSALEANEQYQQNTQNAITMLRYADGALNNILDAAQTIRGLIIQAGDGALDESQLKDITDQIEANKKIMLDNLNTKVAGQYIFGGTDTSTRPFTENSDGSITYNGSDNRIKYAVSDSLLGDISFSGGDIVPKDEDSYFICSHYVPADWEWKGREEKVQITVGNRTLSVFIPEDWSDNDHNKTSTETVNYTDNNGYRDPNEITGISLDDLASIINSSIAEQGASSIVNAYIERDSQSGMQQLIIKSNTGEKVGITGWPDTDYMPMPATATSKDLDSVDWHENNGGLTGIMGNKNIVSWKGDENSGTITITVDGKDYGPIDLSEITSSTSLVDKINSMIQGESDGTPFASLTSGNLSGRLIFQSSKKDISVTGTGNAMNELFGVTDSSLTGTSSKLTFKLNDQDSSTAIVYINQEDDLDSLASKIDAIQGIYARTTADGKRLIVSAQRTGDLPEDRLRINEAEEGLHYPSLTITGEGGAASMFDFNINDNSLKAVSERRIVDQSHIDVFDYLGMETAMKSREFDPAEKLEVKTGEQLHWRVISGGKTADIKLNEGKYTLQDIADRLKNAGAGWLEVSVSEDKDDAYERGTLDAEAMTQRLVIRGYNGEQVLFLDMNEYSYADKMGLSTGLRTDGYSEDKNGMGTKCVNFPSAPCVDDNIGIPMRVQMNCGMYYDINIKRAEVINPETGFVDRNKVMQQIVAQVNAQEGHEIMGCTIHVDASGQEVDDSSAIYFLSGEAFTVVDMPFNDPAWNSYSGGIAAQMGIHGGVTSNLAKTTIKMTDSDTFGDTKNKDGNTVQGAYSKAGKTFTPGTIRFSNLGHSVEIDVSETDTVKDVMDRLRTQAGDWLYVNYYDTHMGNTQDTAVRNSGDYPLLSFSSVDGSAVNILDVKGHIAQDALGISTGIQTRVNPDSTENGGYSSGDFTWDMGTKTFPADTLTITVAGYSHTIDLTAMRDVTNDTEIKGDDLAAFISSRMQDYDVKAEINEDDELMIWSERGYSIQIEFFGATMDDDGNPVKDDITSKFLGSESSDRTYYRGGYNLEGDAATRGITKDDLYDAGIHTQNATIRSGANTMKQNGFGVINDVIAAVKAGNSDALTDNLLPRIDNFINNILTVMSENGALQTRYEYNTERLVTENAIMTDDYDKLVKIDPADAISQLMVADYMYQANLAIISRIIQPSLLDFLS